MESSDDDIEVRLNMEHPLNKEMVEFMNNAPVTVVDAFFARLHRRLVFDESMERIGGLTRYRRKLVARSLVRMFRSGYRTGWMNARRSQANGTEATDGQ